MIEEMGVDHFIAVTRDLGIDVFLPNKEEGAILTGLKDPEAIAHDLTEIYAGSLVILKLDADGALAWLDGVAAPHPARHQQPRRRDGCGRLVRRRVPGAAPRRGDAARGGDVRHQHLGVGDRAPWGAPVARRAGGAADRLSRLSAGGAGTRGRCGGPPQAVIEHHRELRFLDGSNTTQWQLRHALRRANEPSPRDVDDGRDQPSDQHVDRRAGRLQLDRVEVAGDAERDVTGDRRQRIPCVRVVDARGVGDDEAVERFAQRDQPCQPGARCVNRGLVFARQPPVECGRRAESLGTVLAVDRVAEAPHELELTGRLAVGRPPRMRQHAAQLVAWVASGHQGFSPRNSTLPSWKQALSAVSRIGVQYERSG